MRKIGLASAAATVTLAAAPALAGDRLPYASLGDVAPTARLGLAYDLTGIDSAAARRAEHRRAEAIARLSYDLDGIRLGAGRRTAAKAERLAARVRGEVRGIRGKADAPATRLALTAKPKPVVAARRGIAFAEVTPDIFRRAAGQPAVMSDFDDSLAFQAMAELRAASGERLGTVPGGHPLGSPLLRLAAADDRRGRHDRGDGAPETLALRVDADAPTPPAPEPALPASSPPADPAAGTESAERERVPSNFIVFFDFDRAEITEAAARILDTVAVAFIASGQSVARLAGHADRAGSEAYNMTLSQRRAEAVAAYLAARGVPENLMETKAYGESKPLVDTPDGVPEAQNRRVEISLGPVASDLSFR